MHALIASLMAWILFIHALLGCCWHHAHAWHASIDPASRVVKVIPCCGHQHAGKHQTEDRNQEQPPCPCPVERCVGVCTFLPPAKTLAETQLVEAPFDLSAPYLLPVAVIADGFTRTWDCLAGPLESQPPVRLHLLHQILLI